MAVENPFTNRTGECAICSCQEYPFGLHAEGVQAYVSKPKGVSGAPGAIEHVSDAPQERKGRGAARGGAKEGKEGGVGSSEQC